MNPELKEQLLKIIFKNIEDDIGNEIEDYIKENDDNYMIDFRYKQEFSKEDLSPIVKAEFDKIIIQNKRAEKLNKILK
jgi:hypothetical protein